MGWIPNGSREFSKLSVYELDQITEMQISWDCVQFSSVYLFAIENYMDRSKKKSNYLDSHGEEAQKKLAGL